MYVIDALQIMIKSFIEFSLILKGMQLG